MSTVALSELRRVVIKIGSSLLIGEDGGVDNEWLASLSDDVAELRKNGTQTMVVSSGAVAIGSRVLGIDRRTARLEKLQAAAAAGQARLAHAYQEMLAARGIDAAQVLLTPDDTEVRRRFLNIRGTLEQLLHHGVVPVINENDTVSTDELRYGDNDRLAARVAQTVLSDGLILLSDVDGLYSANPEQTPDATHIPVVDEFTDGIFAMASDTVSDIGRGGMTTKLLAAQIAARAGCTTYIAAGTVKRPIKSLADGGRHTVFPAHTSPAVARKQWLAGVLDVRGQLRIDGGAARALRDGGSLLPVGITAVEGDFGRGDAVALVDNNGHELGRGLAAYASDEAQAIKGCRSAAIESRLGYRSRDVMVHRDDMVLFDEESAVL